MLLGPLVQIFSQVLNDGVPHAWCTGRIHPIFKAGNPNGPVNYRGIRLVVILAKLYAMVLEASWAEYVKCRAKGQAGFRKDFRTTDRVFIFQAFIQQAKQAKHKLYCRFVDFRKAFDLAPGQTSWKVFEQRRMKGKVLTSLQSMNAADEACGLTHQGPTDVFDFNLGVKQGCPTSLLLFDLYLDELERMPENASDNDGPCIADILVAILLFADDSALFSYLTFGLQKQHFALPEV